MYIHEYNQYLNIVIHRPCWNCLNIIIEQIVRNYSRRVVFCLAQQYLFNLRSIYFNYTISTAINNNKEILLQNSKNTYMCRVFSRVSRRGYI